MDLATALDQPIHSMTDAEAYRAIGCIGAEKLRIRRKMDWRAIVLGWECGFKVKRDEESWRQLAVLNQRLALLLAYLFRAAGHKW